MSDWAIRIAIYSAIVLGADLAIGTAVRRYRRRRDRV